MSKDEEAKKKSGEQIKYKNLGSDDIARHKRQSEADKARGESIKKGLGSGDRPKR